MPFPSTTLLDDLKGRNEEPLSGGGDWLPLWGESPGRVVITKGWQGSPVAAYWAHDVFTDPAVAVVPSVIPTEGQSLELWACITPGPLRNGYVARFVNTGSFEITMHIERWVGGVMTNLATSAVYNWAGGGLVGFGIDVSGGTISVWANKGGWAAQASASDSTFTTGYVGMGITGAPGELFNFEASEHDPPVIGSLEPAAGTEGVKLTIRGSAFLPGSTVTVGGIPATSVVVASIEEITCTVPPGTGTQPVVVVGFNGSSNALDFVYAHVPENSALPTITGVPKQGEGLEDHHGVWTNPPILSYAYQWLRCNAEGGEPVPIEGATFQTYVLTNADVGHTLRVTETATNTVGHASATSVQTAVIKEGPPTNNSLPTIVGPAVEGEVELEGHGAWTNSPESFAYQWFICDPTGGNPTLIEGSTGKTYVPVPGDVGRTLRVSETATNLGGASSPAVSAPSPVIVATGATQKGLPPTQPDVAEPCLAWPFRMATDESHVAFVEQDTPEEVEQCVALVLATRPGEFPDEPDFGLPDPTFVEGGIAEADLTAVIRKWERRAQTFFTLDELLGFAQEISIEVKPS